MQELRQSSRFQLAPSALRELLVRPPALVDSSQGPSLFWFAPEGFALGARIDYRLHWGVRRIVWSARIESVEGDAFHVCLESGPLRHFFAKHEVLADGEGCVLRDSWSYEFDHQVLDDIAYTAELVWQLAWRGRDGETGLFLAIQSA